MSLFVYLHIFATLIVVEVRLFLLVEDYFLGYSSLLGIGGFAFNGGLFDFCSLFLSVSIIRAIHKSETTKFLRGII